MKKMGSESTKIQVRFSCETVINVIRMIMFISMYLFRIIQLVTAQWLLMFRSWAAEQTPCSASAPIRGLYLMGWGTAAAGLLTAGKHFPCKTCCGTHLFQKWILKREGKKNLKKEECIKVTMSPGKRFPCQGVSA